MKKFIKIPLLTAFFFCSFSYNVRAGDIKTIWLGEIANLTFFESGISAPNKNACYSGTPLKIAGKIYEKGIGARTISTLFFDLQGKAKRFSAKVGQDDASKLNTLVKFYVIGDQKILFESKVMQKGDAPENIDVDLTGIQKLALMVSDDKFTNTGGFGDWVEAHIVSDAAQLLPVLYESKKYILTPAAVASPKINGAKIMGVTPGNPFLFTINATGDRPMKFAANQLPKELSLDPLTGIITGKLNKRGKYVVELIATNKRGTAKRNLTIKVGDTISLTPPIGWNGWNSWAKEISQDKVMLSAKAMLDKGLVNHGWSYINVDDAWQGQRGGPLNGMLANSKFPDFKGMVDTIHAMGMKAGLYSTPWMASYAGYIGGSSDTVTGIFTPEMKNNKHAYRHNGKYRFDSNDAKQWAAWGIDYLKYDWRIEVPSTEWMSVALKNSGRDIVYSISNSAPFDKIADWQRLTNLWRTGGDIRDTWQSLYYCGFTIDKWAPFGGPGHWNDPDMLILGEMSTGSSPHQTRLSADEQYTHVSLWSIFAAPLLIGCPVEKMDDFTVSLLTNDEVIDIDQDVLGISGRKILDENGFQVWVKPLEDGSSAVGVFNTANFAKEPAAFYTWGNEQPAALKVDFEKLGFSGKMSLRDVWRQMNIGVHEKSYTATIPYHGVLFLKMTPVK